MENIINHYCTLIEATSNKGLAETTARIKDATKPTELNPFLTDTRLRQLRDGKIDLATAKEYAVKRYTDTHQKELKKELDDVVDVLNIKEHVTSIKLSISWHKSRMYGLQPTCNATVGYDNGHFDEYEGHAGGCGYDLTSAVIANTLSNCKALKSDLCKLKYKKFTENPEKGFNSHELIAYGAGYGILPYLEGGVGVNCHEKIFELLGMKEVVRERGKTFDLFKFEK